jgi:glycosyltransferase involved in cell wall biosynthesis
VDDTKAPRIGIVVVAYNAATTLVDVLDRIPDEFHSHIEVVLVLDDHSSDTTYEVGLDYAARNTDLPVSVTRNPRNLGYGGNQKVGYQRAIELGLDIVVLLHGDGQYAPELLPEMVAPLARGDSDAVFGSRMMTKGAALKGGMPMYKYVGNRILTGLENLVLGVNLSEFHSGYRAYSVETLKRLPLDTYSDGFDFDTEIIIGLVDTNKRIAEIPIPTYYGSEICYVNGLRYARDVTYDVLRYRAAKAGIGAPGPDVDPSEYELKPTLDSSHSQLWEWMQQRPPMRVLDVGCSGGRFGERLREFDHHVTGVDVAAHPDVEARLDRFVQADLDFGLPMDLGGPFDVVICADVIEHLRRPETILDSIAQVISPTGRLLVSVPNIEHWYPRGRIAFGRFDYDQRGILDADHVRFFSRHSFLKLAERSGWKAVRAATTGVPLEILTPGKGSGLSRLAAAERFGRSVWPTLFAYQFLYELERVRS